MTFADDRQIEIASLSRARRIKRRFDAVLTIEDPGMRKGLRFHTKPHPDHLILLFEDVDTHLDHIAMPNHRQVEAAIDFGREFADKSILVHCKAGVARSTALALGLITDRLGSGSEVDSVRHLLHIRPESVPNLVALAMVDEVLGRDGKLVDAWMRIEHASPVYAEHRHLKSRILERNPGLFAKPLGSVHMTASRFRPDTLVRSPGLNERTMTSPLAR